MKQTPRKPTASELEILRVLWSRGPSTVRQVLDALTEKKEMGYTGVLKLLQIMAAKGTVGRDESQRAHVYEARRPAGQHAPTRVRRLRQPADAACPGGTAGLARGDRRIAAHPGRA